MAFATLDEAWGISGISCVHSKRGKLKDKVKANSRVLENIMDVYTYDTYDTYDTKNVKTNTITGYSNDYQGFSLDDDASDTYQSHLSPQYHQSNATPPSHQSPQYHQTSQRPQTPQIPPRPPQTSQRPQTPQISQRPQTPQISQRPQTPHEEVEIEDFEHAGEDVEDVVKDVKDVVDVVDVVDVIDVKVKVKEKVKAIESVFLLEMLMYVLSGILLIFMMEQLVRLGANMRLR